MHWGRRLFADVCERDSDEAELLARLASPVPVDMLPGCGTLVPAACYRAVGLYDGRMFPHYHADSELTLRAAHGGYRILVDLNAVVYLDESGNDPQAEPIPPALADVLAAAAGDVPALLSAPPPTSSLAAAGPRSARHFLPRGRGSDVPARCAIGPPRRAG